MDNLIRFPLSPEKVRDDKRAQIARPYLDRLFAHFALNGNFQWYDGDHEITKRVQLAGADLSLVCRYTHALRYAEVKTDFHMPYNFCLETISNTRSQPQVPGWMVTAKADRLVTSFVWLEGVLDVFVNPFQDLQAWFWRGKNYQQFRKYTVPNSTNNTESRIVPITTIINNVETTRYLITHDGQIFSVPLAGQDTIDVVRRVLDKKGYPFKKLADEKAS